MSRQERYAKRKALGIGRPGLHKEDVRSGGEPVALLAAAIDSIIEARAHERFNDRMSQSKGVLLRSVAVPFGLGHLVAAWDRTGGDVHTVNNVRNGVYASSERQAEYEGRTPYSKEVGAAVRNEEQFREVRTEAADAHRSRLLDDAYTGKRRSADGSSPHIDHVVSVHEIHNDPGRLLAGIATGDLANRRENLVATAAAINCSKKEKSVEDVIARYDRIRDKQEERVAELESKAELTPAEQMELQSRKTLLEADPELMRQRDAHARESMDEQINSAWYGGAAFRTELLTSVGTSTVKTAAMAALGEFLIEFIAATWDEVRDWCVTGRGGQPLLNDLRARLQRIADRLIARKEAAWAALKAGALGGFVAALISAILNAFFTTRKRVQRLLREGSQAFVRLVGQLVNPPDGMSAREGVYMAMQTGLTAGVIMGGIALEEVFDTAIKVHLPILAPAAAPIAVVLAGVVSGMVVVLSLSLLDHLDPLGVLEEKDLARAIGDLSGEIADAWGSGSPVVAG